MKEKMPSKNRQRSHIAVFLGDVNTYSSLIWEGLQSVAEQENVDLCCFMGRDLVGEDGPSSNANKIYQLATDRVFDGLIVLTAGLGQEVTNQYLAEFCQGYAQLPLVAVGEKIGDHPSLLLDNRTGFQELLMHLIDIHEYRKLAFVKGPENNPEAQERYQVYREVLEQSGLPFDPNLVVPGGFSTELGAEAAQHLLSSGLGYDAICAADDDSAVGVLQVMQNQGVHVPHDIAVTGFDDIVDSQYTLPPLSTVHQPIRSLGTNALEMMLAYLQDGSPPQDRFIPTRAVIRQSCGCMSPQLAYIVSNSGSSSGTDQPEHKGVRESVEQQLLDQRDQIEKELVKTLERIPYSQAFSEFKSRVLDLLEAFYAVCCKGQPQNTFIFAFDKLLRLDVGVNQEINAWQAVISEMRRCIQPYLTHEAMFLRTENIWQQARVMLSEMGQQVQAQRRIQATQQALTISQINQELITAFDFSRLMIAISDTLPLLEIRHALVFLFEQHEQGSEIEQTSLPSQATLILAYVNGMSQDLPPDGIDFPTLDLCPPGILLEDQRYDFLVMPLRFQEALLGYLILEMISLDGFIYDSLEIQVSTALQGSMLISQLREAQMDLENRVVERTIELEREIAERMHAEELSRENQLRYRALFEQTTDAVIIFGLDTKHLVVNQTAADLLGYTVDEMMNLTGEKFIAPDELADGRRRLEMALQGQEVPLYDRNLTHKDGSLVPVEVNLSLVRDSNGNPLHFQTIFRDISTRKRTERILKGLNSAALAMQQAHTPEEIFSAVSKQLKTLGYVCTIFQLSDDSTKLYPKYFSYESWAVQAAEKLIGKTVQEFSISTDSASVFSTVIWKQETVFVENAAEATREFLPPPLKMISSRLVSLLRVTRSINAPFVVDGKVIGLLSVQSHDLTREDVSTVTAFAHQMAAAWKKAQLIQDLEISFSEQIRTEKSLRESEERYRTLFELSPEATMIVGLNGILLDANQATESLGDGFQKELVGQSFLDLGVFPPGKESEYLDLFTQAISGGIDGPVQVDILINGKLRWIEIHPALLEQLGEPVALQIILRDITERKQAEAAMRERMLELEALHQLSLELTITSPRVNEIALIAVQQLLHIFKAEKCSFGLLSDDHKYQSIVAQVSAEDASQLQGPQDGPLDMPIYPSAARLIETRRHVVINANDIDPDTSERAEMEEAGISTMLLIPLIRERVFGIMTLGFDETRSYTEQQINLAYTLINQVTVAYDNARLLETAQQEIFERLQAEIALQESEAQFRSVFENATMGIYRSTPGGEIIMGNPALVRMLGYETFDALAERNLDQDSFASDMARAEFIRIMESDGQVIGHETIWLRKNGTKLYVQESAKAIFDSNGRVMYFEGTVEDITERKRVERERHALIEFQQLVAVLSARFINLETAEIEIEIGRALQTIAEYAGVDAASVWLFEDNQKAASKAFGWPTNRKEASNQGVPISRFPWVFGEILQNRSVKIAGLAQIPPEAEDARVLLRLTNYQVLLGVPLVSEGHVFGILAVFMVAEDKDWQDDLESLLKIIGDIIVNALERKRADESIHQLNDELELRVIQRTQQLQAANQELEAFAYSVSHDLRAPLRAIDGFSLALVEDYGEHLDHEAQDYLTRVRTASQRMGQLIDDLLKLSRVTRSEMQYQHVDLTAMVEEVLSELQENDPDREAKFSVQSGVSVLGDERLLRVALVNLCGNAWKFSSRKDTARIEFSCMPGEEGSVFCVRDNGAGFDMAYADKLFGTFQRLHTVNDFEGTGIGLATVKRIILRHGGTIWADSQIDQGAAFFFTIGDPPTED